MTTPKEYALLAKRAYASAPDIGAEDTSARAVFAIGGDGLSVAFPGTNNLACWLADLDCLVRDITGFGQVHAGFYDAYLSIRPLLLAKPIARVTVGHSEGAALALLHAADLCLLGKAPLAVYAFEPPHVSCDDVLAAVFEKYGVKMYLYRNGEDVVPLVPRIMRAWRHPAELIAIGTATLPVPNVEDHMIDAVIASL